MFKPGVSGNPGGRPRLDKSKMFLSLILESKGFDWVEDFTEALKTNNLKRIEAYVQIMPFLCAEMRVKEFEVKPDTPEASVQNVDEMILKKKMEALSGVGPAHT